MARNEPVEVAVELVSRDSDGAILCWVDGEKHWILKSQLRDPEDPECPLPDAEHPEEGDEDVTILIPRWLAEEKGLV